MLTSAATSKNCSAGVELAVVLKRPQGSIGGSNMLSAPGMLFIKTGQEGYTRDCRDRHRNSFCYRAKGGKTSTKLEVDKSCTGRPTSQATHHLHLKNASLAFGYYGQPQPRNQFTERTIPLASSAGSLVMSLRMNSAPSSRASAGW